HSRVTVSCLLLLPRPPPISPLFPYTTLFRSRCGACVAPIPVEQAWPEKTQFLRTVGLDFVLTQEGGVGFLDPVKRGTPAAILPRSEEHTSELQSLRHLVCRLLLEKKKTTNIH